MDSSILDLSGKMEIPCISEEHYKEEMARLVEPYLMLCKETGYYEELYYELFRQEEPRGTIVLSYGFTESCEKYHEMIYYFHKQRYQTAVIEHRGHGKSVRQVENKYLVHIESFQQYVEDLHGFIVEKVFPIRAGMPLYLYAHSMGGCIGALYLEQHPSVFTKAVLNAPMLGIQLGGLPIWIARLICRFFMIIGKGKERVFLMQEFQEEEPFSASGTDSRARYDFYRDMQKACEEYQTCCSTYHWVYEAFRAGRRATRAKNMARVETPVLLFQATQDTFVTKEEQERFVEGIGNGRLITVQSRHEIGRGTNQVMEPYLAQVFQFFG